MKQENDTLHENLKAKVEENETLRARVEELQAQLNESKIIVNRSSKVHLAFGPQHDIFILLCSLLYSVTILNFNILYSIL